MSLVFRGYAEHNRSVMVCMGYTRIFHKELLEGFHKVILCIEAFHEAVRNLLEGLYKELLIVDLY